MRTSSRPLSYLKKLPGGSGKVGVTGFCYGGGVANFLATKVPDLAAAVPFYGTPPAPEEAGNIKAPLLLQFAETDERINAAWPASEEALKKAGVKYHGVRLSGHAARLQQRHDAAI